MIILHVIHLYLLKKAPGNDVCVYDVGVVVEDVGHSEDLTNFVVVGTPRRVVSRLGELLDSVMDLNDLAVFHKGRTRTTDSDYRKRVPVGFRNSILLKNFEPRHPPTRVQRNKE